MTCRSAVGSLRTSPKLIPGSGNPPVSASSNPISTSAAVRLHSPLSTLPAGILVPTFPQRSPPLLLTTAACGGLRSAPDCRPRRALLHLSYSCATPCGPALLVTQCHLRTFGSWSIAETAQAARRPPFRAASTQTTTRLNRRIPGNWNLTVAGSALLDINERGERQVVGLDQQLLDWPPCRKSCGGSAPSWGRPCRTSGTSRDCAKTARQRRR